MTEIRKPLLSITDYLSQHVIIDDLVITSEHSINDVVLWLLDQETPEEIISLVLDNVKELQRDEKIKLLTKIHSQLIDIASFE